MDETENLSPIDYELNRIRNIILPIPRYSLSAVKNNLLGDNSNKYAASSKSLAVNYVPKENNMLRKSSVISINPTSFENSVNLIDENKHLKLENPENKTTTVLNNSVQTVDKTKWDDENQNLANSSIISVKPHKYAEEVTENQEMPSKFPERNNSHAIRTDRSFKNKFFRDNMLSPLSNPDITDTASKVNGINHMHNESIVSDQTIRRHMSFSGPATNAVDFYPTAQVDNLKMANPMINNNSNQVTTNQTYLPNNINNEITDQDKWYLRYIANPLSDTGATNKLEGSSYEREIMNARSKKFLGINRTRKFIIPFAIVLCFIFIILLAFIIFLLYYFGSIVKLSYQDSCISEYLCNQTKLLKCRNFKCGCESQYYYSTTFQMCTASSTVLAVSSTIFNSPVTSVRSSSATTKSVSTATTTMSHSGYLYGMFSNNLASSSITKTYAGSINLKDPYGVTYLNTNEGVVYYIVDANLNRIIAYNDDLTYNSSSNIGKSVTYIESNTNTNEIFVTDPSLDLFKTNTGFQLTMNLADCTNCDLQGMYYDATSNQLFVCDTQNNQIHVYDASTYFEKRIISTSTYNPYSVSIYNNNLYVGSDNTVVVMSFTGAIQNTFTNMCTGRGTTINCIAIDDLGYVAVPCSQNNKLNLYYYTDLSSQLYSLTSSSPNCLAYDYINHRLIVTSTGQFTVYF